MADNPRENILISPEWSYLYFGDGYVAMMQGAIEREDADGTMIVEATIKPHKNLIKRYNIKDSDVDSNFNIQNYIMRKEDLIPLNLFDDSNRAFLYVKNYLHEETDLGKRDWELRKMFESEQKKRIISEGEIIFLSEQLQLSTTNPTEFLAQGLEFFKQISDTNLDMLNRKQEKPNG